MSHEDRDRLVVDATGSATPEIARALWRIEEARERLTRLLERVTPGMVDWEPGPEESTIGTVLYHIADIEADWLFVEVLEAPLPADLKVLFPIPTRDAAGRLTPAPGYTLDQHVDRLETVRGRLLAAFAEMDLADFRRERSLPRYDVTPEWVLHHLAQHEAEHRGQIGSIVDRAERVLGE